MPRKFKGARGRAAKAFAKPPSDLSDYAKEIKLSEQSCPSPFTTCSGRFKSAEPQKINRPSETRISRQEIPIEERMTQIVDCLKSSRKGCIYGTVPV
ncbi:segregation/condensation protein A [Bacillus licheniformis]|nr:segregation/condensation protein A [Bacillus licheniformis]